MNGVEKALDPPATGKVNVEYDCCKPGVLLRLEGDVMEGETGDMTDEATGAILASPTWRKKARVAQSANWESWTLLEQAKMRAVAQAWSSFKKKARTALLSGPEASNKS